METENKNERLLPVDDLMSSPVPPGQALLPTLGGQNKSNISGGVWVGERLKREKIHVYLQLIHSDVWQKPTQLRRHKRPRFDP